jgi:hypothetical protein
LLFDSLHARYEVYVFVLAAFAALTALITALENFSPQGLQNSPLSL